MKFRIAVASLAVCLAGLASSFADDANMGTWKLNEAKSKLGRDANKNTSVVYSATDSSTYRWLN